MKRNFIFKLIFIFTLVFLFGRSVLAADLSVIVDKNIFQENDLFTVKIILNTAGQSVNTIEGNLNYDKSLVKVETINTGSSFVNFWVNQPDLKTPGVIYFSGVTPGGVNTGASEVFRIVFRAQSRGDINFILNGVNLYLNDGKGSILPVKIKNTNVKVLQTRGAVVPFDEIKNDKVPPEKFNIERTNDFSLFDNKYFVVFSTTDKGSGIDHYEMCEFFKCVFVSSPALLWNQTPFYHLTIKAFDMNGNYTSATLTSKWFILMLFLLFVVIIYLCLYLRKNLLRK